MKGKLVFLLLALLLSGMMTGTAKADENRGIVLYCLNVGKADCLILQCSGKSYVIDTGNEYTDKALLCALDQLGIGELDGVFLTHCDRDHYGGLLALSQSGIRISHWYASDCFFFHSKSQIIRCVWQR